MCLAIPGKVVETFREHDVRMGKVDFGGILKRVCLEHVPEAGIDDYVLVHVGFALSRIDQTEAKRVFDFLGTMNQLDELNGPPLFEEGEARPAPDQQTARPAGRHPGIVQHEAEGPSP
jgi:hydrogenase expression/formation protein HypC